MTIDTSKQTAFIQGGDPVGINTAKQVVYIQIEVGTEAGATPPDPRQSFTYAQILSPSGRR